MHTRFGTFAKWAARAAGHPARFLAARRRLRGGADDTECPGVERVETDEGPAAPRGARATDA